jgi:hypothetical protein
VDGALSLYRHHFARLLSITAVVYVPFGIAQLGLTYWLVSVLPSPTIQSPVDAADFAIPGELIVAALAFGVIGALLMLVGQAAMCWAVSEIYLGSQVTAADAYAHVLRRFRPLLLTLMLATLVTGLPLTPGLAILPFGVTGIGFTIAGALLLLAGVVPTIIFAVLFAFVVPVLIVEGRAYAGALARSRQLVAGQFWHVVGTLLVLSVLVAAVSSALTTPASVAAVLLPQVTPLPWPLAQTAAQSVGSITALLLSPIQLIGTVLVYYDLRIRKEGFDLDRMAAELEAAG